jgi:hypothetical protein
VAEEEPIDEPAGTDHPTAADTHVPAQQGATQ